MTLYQVSIKYCYIETSVSFLLFAGIYITVHILLILDADLVNQVSNVRAHVYYPMLNSDVVSAQIVWEALDDHPTAYDVIIKTADSSMNNVMVYHWSTFNK